MHLPPLFVDRLAGACRSSWSAATSISRCSPRAAWASCSRHSLAKRSLARCGWRSDVAFSCMLRMVVLITVSLSFFFLSISFARAGHGQVGLHRQGREAQHDCGGYLAGTGSTRWRAFASCCCSLGKDSLLLLLAAAVWSVTVLQGLGRHLLPTVRAGYFCIHLEFLFRLYHLRLYHLRLYHLPLV